jgi:hypothetical protein
VVASIQNVKISMEDSRYKAASCLNAAWVHDTRSRLHHAKFATQELIK